MGDSQSDPGPQRDASRMELDADAFHEDEDGLSIDCPQCGATVPLSILAADGRCPNALDPDDVEVETDATTPQEGACSARLGLELVWWADEPA